MICWVLGSGVGLTFLRLTATSKRGGHPCCEAIFVILLAAWLLGMVTSYTLGGFIHILLLLAIAAVLIRVIQGRRPV